MSTEEMPRQILVEATDHALLQLVEPRFFRTERGFHGRFYCALQKALDKAGLLMPLRILEMEYQKSGRHGLTQRPDIILHVPAEDSGSSVQIGNSAVWALKRRATISDAQEDFVKLDEMFGRLSYQFGFFINVDSTEHRREGYKGKFDDRLYTVAIRLVGSRPKLKWAMPEGHEFIK